MDPMMAFSAGAGRLSAGLKLIKPPALQLSNPSVSGGDSHAKGQLSSSLLSRLPPSWTETTTNRHILTIGKTATALGIYKKKEVQPVPDSPL